MKKQNQKIAGFTLVELLVAITVLAILLTMAVPSFTELITGNRTVVQTDRLTRDLNYTRNEAIKLGQQVSICKSNNGTDCQTGGGTNWEEGWIVFSDDNGDGDLNGVDVRLRVSDGLEQGFTLRAGTRFSDWIGYLASGVSRGDGGPNDTFRLCRSDADTVASRSIVVNVTGRVSVRAGTTVCP